MRDEPVGPSRPRRRCAGRRILATRRRWRDRGCYHGASRGPRGPLGRRKGTMPEDGSGTGSSGGGVRQSPDPMREARPPFHEVPASIRGSSVDRAEQKRKAQATMRPRASSRGHMSDAGNPRPRRHRCGTHQPEGDCRPLSARARGKANPTGRSDLPSYLTISFSPHPQPNSPHLSRGARRGRLRTASRRYATARPKTTLRRAASGPAHAKRETKGGT